MDTIDRTPLPATLDGWKGKRVRVTAGPEIGRHGTVCTVAMDEPPALDVLLDQGGGFAFLAPTQLLPDLGKCDWGRRSFCGCPAGECRGTLEATLEAHARAKPRATEDADEAASVWDLVARMGVG